MSLFHDLEQIRARLGREQPDVVAVTACTPTVNAALEVLRAAKRGGPRRRHRDRRRAPQPHGRRGARRRGGRLRGARRRRDDAARAPGLPVALARARLRRRGLLPRRQADRRHPRPAAFRRSRSPAGGLGPDRLAHLPLPHQTGLTPGHRELGARLHRGLQLLFAAEVLAPHLEGPRRGGGRRRGAHSARPLRRRHARGGRRVPDARSRALGAHPRSSDRGGPGHRAAGRDTRRRRRARRRHHRQVPGGRHPAHVRRRRIGSPGPPRRHAQEPAGGRFAGGRSSS